MTPSGGFSSATGGAPGTPYSYGSDRITGTRLKFSGGGGDESCHSRLRARHGLPTSGSRQNSMDITKLIRKIRIEPPSKNAEIETQSLSVCRLRAYSNTRRGMPSMPSANNGRKVELKKMNMVQKWILPSRSFSLIPVIFGSQ